MCTPQYQPSDELFFKTASDGEKTTEADKLLQTARASSSESSVADGAEPRPSVEVPVETRFEDTSTFFEVVSSIPADSVIDRSWMSQRGERVEPATPRRHRPYNYEFMEAKYWPYRGGRYGKATTQLGHRPNPACRNCHLLPAPYGEDPPSLRVPRRRSAQPDPSILMSSKLPPYKVPSDKVSGLLPNPWCKRWGASLAEDSISTCAGCGCFVRPPVTDTSYLNVDHDREICAGGKPCYYNGYSLSRQPVAQPAPLGKPTAADYVRGQPPRRWWITFERPVIKPELPDYTRLRPRAAPPPCYSRFEINSVSGVKSQWIA